MYECIGVCACVYVCVHACVCVRVCVHMISEITAVVGRWMMETRLQGRALQPAVGKLV